MSDRENTCLWLVGMALIAFILVCIGLIVLLFQARIDTFDARLFATMTAVYTQ